MNNIILCFVSSFILFFCPSGYLAVNPFEEFQKQAKEKNPVIEASHRVGYGGDSLQPYFVCDSSTSESKMPLSAWHYSCKQACLEDKIRSAIDITRISWHYIGKSIPVYKVTTNEVCYTSHENMWGYCSHTQTTRPVPTSIDDRSKIHDTIFKRDHPISGVQTIVNSKHAVCDYLSDNTQCARDYVVTFREGRTSKKGESDSEVLNIYGDGIRTDPKRGALYLNDAAWFWDDKAASETAECGWVVDKPTTCHITETSELMYCPDIGYQYNIHVLAPSKTCKGEVYDINGPAPFLYGKSAPLPKRDDIMSEAAKGKGDPDINMIKGINSAFERVEEAYCSSSCDLFSRGYSHDDDQVLDTPIGNWRLAGSNSSSPYLIPCSPTATWRIKSPTTICHGKDHVLVEDSKTHHVCSWNTRRDFITVDEVCSSSNEQAQTDFTEMRKKIASHQDISISFWTGDELVMSPPYTNPVWKNKSRSFSRNPGWFSKVELDKGMLHNQQDLSRILTVMMANTKQEVLYNQTVGRTIKTMFFEEVVQGLGSVGGKIIKLIVTIISAVPKFLIILLCVIAMLFFIKTAIERYMLLKVGSAIISKRKSVSFPDITPEFLTPMPPPAPRKRPVTRSSRLARELAETDF